MRRSRKILALSLLVTALGFLLTIRHRVSTPKALPSTDTTQATKEMPDLSTLTTKAKELTAKLPPVEEPPILKKIEDATRAERQAYDQSLQEVDRDLAAYDRIHALYVKALQNKGSDLDDLVGQLKEAEQKTQAGQQQMLAAYKAYRDRFAETALALQEGEGK